MTTLRTVGFAIKLGDGTCMKVVGGQLDDVWIEGERPKQWAGQTPSAWDVLEIDAREFFQRRSQRKEANSPGLSKRVSEKGLATKRAKNAAKMQGAGTAVPAPLRGGASSSPL